MKNTVKHKNLSLKRKQSKRQAQEFSRDGLYNNLLHNAEVIGIPHGAAETMADEITKAVDQWVAKYETITTDDLERQVVKEAKKYSPDLAYVYQNRGKII